MTVSEIDENASLSIGEAAQLTGLPTETIRFYDRAGLIGELPRTVGGRRIFDRAALGLLDVVIRLRRTGMPVQDVRRFVDLIAAGDTEKSHRLALLVQHRERVVAQRDQLAADLAVIEWKIAAYSTPDGHAAPPPPPGWPNPGPELPPLERFAADDPDTEGARP